jgi:predicted O-methyltransferase YrrM
MSRELWANVDDYFESRLLPPDASLDASLAAADAAAVPAMNVSATQGMMLELLARMVNARKILEIGTLAGYSAIWMARALPAGGKLTTLERDASYAQVAIANIDRAGFADRISVRVGAALDTLPMLEAEHAGPFDFFFIDADKANNARYFEWALQLARPGSVIVIDNVVRNGAVIDANSRDANVQGVRELNDLIAAERDRVSATAIQTVGNKGYDGFILARVS